MASIYAWSDGNLPHFRDLAAHSPVFAAPPLFSDSIEPVYADKPLQPPGAATEAPSDSKKGMDVGDPVAAPTLVSLGAIIAPPSQDLGNCRRAPKTGSGSICLGESYPGGSDSGGAWF